MMRTYPSPSVIHAVVAHPIPHSAGMPRARRSRMAASTTPTFDVFLQIIVWSAITVGLIMAIAVVLM